MGAADTDRILAEVDRAADEIVAFTSDLVRIPTVNPPGDMKAGIAAALFALEAIARAGVALPGSVEISGTVDEESGGFAGVAYLAGMGRIAKARTSAVIIPEPLNVDRICIGH